MTHAEFRKFVEKAERQLLALFRAIDKNHDGKLDKSELQVAFKSAGLTVSKRRLSEFFDDMDGNHDGYINFDEWRFVKLFYIQFQFETCMWARWENQMVVVGDDQSYANINVMCQARGVKIAILLPHEPKILPTSGPDANLMNLE